MYNVKVFPSFEASANASDKDRKFLSTLKKIKVENKALYVNFSVFDYKTERTESAHFVTYPIDWITHYIQAQYIEVDPLFKIDYRRLSYTDWTDIQKRPRVQEMFRKFQERGLGNNGITLVNHIEGNIYGVSSLSFETSHEKWAEFRTSNMDMFRLNNQRLCEQYASTYMNIPGKKYNISNREIECLFWVAMGKTDDQIAETLCIGKWTVVSHLKSAKFKLDCPNRAAAVALAISLGIINIKKTG